MGKHYRGKHRLIQPRNVRARTTMGAAVVALGLSVGLIASPIAAAQPTSSNVALQAYSTTLVAAADKNKDDHHNDGDRNRRGPSHFRGPIRHSPIHFRGPVRRGHWENVCGPHRVWVPRLHRTIVERTCPRVWRNW